MSALLQEIAHCPHVKFCIQNPSVEHSCHEIIFSQSVSTLDEYQVPEPWSGCIENALILFLSSNPSIGSAEEYPHWSWSEDVINDFFNNRFGGSCKQWSMKGTKTLLKNGKYSGVRFWMAVRQRAIELLERDVNPGCDYAITEIVHCKSMNEIGVATAQKQCVKTYLRKVLEITSARVVVVLGARARQAMQDEFSIPKNVSLAESIIGEQKRLITFLPHPNARTVRSFTKRLESDELEKLRTFLRAPSHCKNNHNT